MPPVTSRVKMKRSFEKKAILKQKLREGQKQKLREMFSEEVTEDDFSPAASSTFFDFANNLEQ